MTSYRPISGTSPCRQCPFRRRAPAGWLGEGSPGSFIAAITQEQPLPCHPTIDYAEPDWLERWTSQEVGKICAGSLILSANMGKLPRDPRFPRLPADDSIVFGSHLQFIAHHESSDTRSWEFNVKEAHMASEERRVLTDDQLRRLIAHSRIGRQNTHTRAIRADATAALAGDDDASMQSSARTLRELTMHPNAIGVCGVERSPTNKARWALSLLCGHDAWVTSRTKPTDRMHDCERCPRAGGPTQAAAPGRSPAPRRRRFHVRIDVTIEVDQRLIDVALAEEWQARFYRMRDAGEVAEHLAYNLVQDRTLTQLDGFADQEDGMATIEEVEASEATEVAAPRPEARRGRRRKS